MTHAATPPTAPMPPDQSASAGGNGLAIAALVCGIVGLCVPLLGVVGIVLGVVSLAKGRGDGRGLAIGGIVTGVLGLLATAGLMVAIMLPAIGQARMAARQAKSGIQMQQIVVAIRADADAPPADANLESRYTLSPDIWVSPAAEGNPRSYLRIVPEPGAELEAEEVLLVENPDAVDSRALSVALADGSIDTLPRSEVLELLKAAGPRVRHSDGTPWIPAK
jgi:hypothetical protein